MSDSPSLIRPLRAENIEKFVPVVFWRRYRNKKGIVIKKPNIGIKPEIGKNQKSA